MKTILVINCGSSSIKFAVITTENTMTVMNGMVECINSADACLSWQENTERHIEMLPHADYLQSISAIAKLLDEKKLTETILAIGHRVVHGGEQFKQSTLITDVVLHDIEKCSHLA